MCQKLVLAAGLVGSLGLAVRAAEPAGVNVTDAKCPIAEDVVKGFLKEAGKGKVAAEIEGQLELVTITPARPFPGWMGYLAVRSNGRLLRLKLGGSGPDMWELEERYRGQTVLVTGALERDRVRVSAVRAVGEDVR
jgi:hypothetical protein